MSAHPSRRGLLAWGSWAALAYVGGCSRSARTSSLGHAPPDWNPAEIAWRAYAPGLDEASISGKPVLLVFYTDWCPHCHNYSRLFHDGEVTRLAKSFVMIRVERDAHRDISSLYDLDGEYIPRTLFLSSDGMLAPGLDAGRDPFRYFLDEHDPAELTRLMEAALARHATGSAGAE